MYIVIFYMKDGNKFYHGTFDTFGEANLYRIKYNTKEVGSQEIEELRKASE